MGTEEIVERLRRVREPVTGESIVDLGMVIAVTGDEDGIRVYLDLSRMARGPFMDALTWPVRMRIVRDAVAVLEDLGKVEILDARSLQRYYPEDE